MAHTCIPVFGEDCGAATSVQGLGNLGIGAQMAITAGITLASTALSLGFQMKMAKDERKYQESLAKSQERKAKEMQDQAAKLEAEARAEMEKQKVIEEAKAEKAAKLKRTVAITGAGLAGVALVAAVVGYFVFRKAA